MSSFLLPGGTVAVDAVLGRAGYSVRRGLPVAVGRQVKTLSFRAAQSTACLL